MNLKLSVAKHLLPLIAKPILEAEFNEQKRPRRFTERFIEYRFALDCINRSCPRKVLDVGSGTTSFAQLVSHCGCDVSAVDNVTDYWAHGMVNRHYKVIDDDILQPRKINGPFDLITCISVLEHIPDHATAMKNMIGMLRSGGNLVLTIPFTTGRYIQNVYDLPDAAYRPTNYICQSFCPDNLLSWQGLGVETVNTEYWRCWTGKYWPCGKKLTPYMQVPEGQHHQLACFMFEKI